ncbi:MAG: hypothetical protein ACRDQZ_02075 [Mycobacteriales bacterium]
MAPGHGRADYLLYIDKRAVEVIEAKPVGTPLSGVEWQSAKYAQGLPTEVRRRALTARRSPATERSDRPPAPSSARWFRQVTQRKRVRRMRRPERASFHRRGFSRPLLGGRVVAVLSGNTELGMWPGVVIRGELELHREESLFSR